MTTITIKGREFTVTVKDDDDMDEKGVSYQLDGARGARYFTLRNVNRPEMMFLAGGGRHGFGNPFPDVWLTDADGTLRVR